MIGMSEQAAAANPALARWLTGAGLPCRPVPAADGPTIWDAAEADRARPGDLVI
jgi:hypothetical protein